MHRQVSKSLFVNFRKPAYYLWLSVVKLASRQQLRALRSITLVSFDKSTSDFTGGDLMSKHQLGEIWSSSRSRLKTWFCGIVPHFLFLAVYEFEF